MTPLVVDASAALAYVLGEPGKEHVEREIEGRDDVLVPGLFWSELINTLARPGAVHRPDYCSQGQDA